MFPLKGEPRLQFQTAIVGRLGKSGEASAACGLIRAPEQRRCDVADDWTRIRVIEEIDHLHREAQSVNTLGAEFYRFGDVRCERDCSRTAAIVPMQDSLVRCGIGIKQAVDSGNDAKLVWICRNAGPSIE